MRAWQFVGINEPMQLAELEDPSPGPGQVVVETRAAGLCHSDVGFLDGTLTWMLTRTPIVLGHEVAGVVAAVGSNVVDFVVGDRVGIAGLGLDAPGIADDGGFGSKVIGKVEQLVRIPDGVSYAQAAAGTDAGQTTRHALRVGGVEQGTKVGIVGLGGLGMTAARIAVLLGADVYGAEPNRDVWQRASSNGVLTTVSDIRDLSGHELDVIVDLAGFGTTTAGAIEAVRAGGTVVQVGMGKVEATIDVTTLVSKQVSLIGSLGGSMEDTVDVYRLLGEGNLEIHTQEIGFDDIPSGLDRLHVGGVQGRLIAVYDN